MQDERYSAIECILFVSGEPVSLVQLQRALDITGIEMNAIIHNMEKQYRQEERGIQLHNRRHGAACIQQKIRQLR